MSRRFILSSPVILGAVLFLAAGELASGTDLAYVALMSVAVLAICTTYNMLGGLGTIGGVIFSAFALYVLVLSQFVKVFVFEAADLDLRAPDLTIAVYAVFFVSLMVGVFLFGWIRLKLPQPLEPESSRHAGIMYVICFVFGLTAKVYMTNLVLEHPELADSAGHGVARALSLLLPLSLVVAVDRRMRKTEGRHCFGWGALWPTLAIELFGFAAGIRTNFVTPPLLVAVTCYFRGYKFRARHYIAMAAMAAVLFFVVSPWYLFSRRYRHQSSLKEQITTAVAAAAEAPQHWKDIEDVVRSRATLSAARGLEYFSKTGTVTLNRLELIAPDDGVIAATAHHHWGLTTVKLDIQENIPHFIEPNKPDRDGVWYRASVGGLQSSYMASTYITTSLIADTWGGFGWAGVVAVPLVLLPWVFVLYDSMFEMSRPWGTVITLQVAMRIALSGIGQLLMGFLLIMPISILLVSWFTGWVARFIPLSGDKPHREGVPLFAPGGVDNITAD